MYLQLRTMVLVGGQAASPLLFAHFWMKGEAKTEKSRSRSSCNTPKVPADRTFLTGIRPSVESVLDYRTQTL